MMKAVHILASAAFVALAAQTAAAEAPRGNPYCFPAKGIGNMVERINNVDADRRDVVNVTVVPKFLIRDDGPWPERFFIRNEGQEYDVPVITPSGETPGFVALAKTHERGEVCVADSARADLPASDESLYFEMGLSPLFQNTSGRHDMAELEEGAKDGKAFYKQMVPAAFRMFTPATESFAVKYETETPPQIFALTADGEVELPSIAYRDMHVVTLEQIEEAGGTALIVKGGAYNLQPTPTVEFMKRLDNMKNKKQKQLDSNRDG